MYTLLVWISSIKRAGSSTVVQKELCSPETERLILLYLIRTPPYDDI